jgi:pimeloyl-ACP methyl ester carboxylesterase
MNQRVVEGWAWTPEQTRLFYVTRGEGIPIVICNGIGVEWQSYWPEISMSLADSFQVVNWDYRGHGGSDSPIYPEQYDISECARDLARVMDALELPKAVLCAHSMGCQVIFEFYRLFPERVLGLIPVLGHFKSPLDTFMNFKFTPVLFKMLAGLVFRKPLLAEKIWPLLYDPTMAQPLSRLTGMVHPTRCPPQVLEMYLKHMARMNPTLFFRLGTHMQEHSAEELLETIDVPTLIFAGEWDLFTPLAASKEMERRIPNAELELVREGSHAAIAEQPQLFWLRIAQFVGKHFKDVESITEAA